MKPNKSRLIGSAKKWIIACFCSMISFTMMSQSIDLDVIGSNGKVNEQIAWTVGEIILRNNNPSILTDGFHQGELLVTSTINLYPLLEINIYPNPTISSIHIKHDYTRQLNFQLVDISGRPLRKGSLNTNMSSIDVSDFQSGNYFLLLFDTHTLLSTSKIIKI
jgi:hypothetical protein